MLTTRLVALIAATAMGWQASAATAEQTARDASLMAFLKLQLGPPDPAIEDRGGTATQVQFAWADLNGDGSPEAVVYVSGRRWCGTGGCNLMILQREGETYRLRGKLTVTRPPVGLLAQRTSGWHDLAVSIGGVAGYRAVVPFDGQRYASNPSMPPARRLGDDVPEQILIPEVHYPFLGS